MDNIPYKALNFSAPQGKNLQPFMTKEVSKTR